MSDGPRYPVHRQPAYWVLVFLIVLCFSLLAFGLNRTNEIAQQVQAGQCSLKEGYKAQLANTNRYLNDPELRGRLERSIGLTRADLLIQKTGLENRLEDLKFVECD